MNVVKEKYFCKLNYRFSEKFIQEILSFAVNNIDEFKLTYPNITNTEFLQLNKNLETFANNSFINDLLNYADYCSISILKVAPKHCMNWHIDPKRQCSINIPIHGLEESYTFFGEKVAEDHLPIYLVDYSIGVPVLLNTQEEHTVINYSDKPRYILCFGFFRENTYQNILNFLTKKQYISYNDYY